MASHRCQTRNATEPLLTLSLEHDLDPELLTILIEPGPKPPLAAINLPSLQLKPTSLIRLRSNNQILKVLIRRLLDLLLESRHKPHPRRHTSRDLLVLQLKQQPSLPRQRIPNLGNLIPRPPDLNRLLLDLHPHSSRKRRGVLVLPLTLLARRSTGEVGLVLAALRVRQVRAIVLVHRQAQPTLETADVVLEEVGVFVQVDGFQSELAQSFASVCVRGALGGYASASEFGTCSVLFFFY